MHDGELFRDSRDCWGGLTFGMRVGVEEKKLANRLWPAVSAEQTRK